MQIIKISEFYNIATSDNKIITSGNAIAMAIVDNIAMPIDRVVIPIVDEVGVPIDRIINPIDIVIFPNV